MSRTVVISSLAVVVIALAWLTGAGCDVDREIYDFDDNAELQAYIHQEPRAKELFRRDSLFISAPYFRPTDSIGEYRDFVDSTVRRIYIEGEPDGDFIEIQGPAPHAEVVVIDEFLILTERTTPDGVDTTFEWRPLTRIGFFLKLGNPRDQAFSGWVLHGFNGGAPRAGTMVAQRSDGFSFRVDALDYHKYRYLTYYQKKIQDSTGGYGDSVVVTETRTHQTEYEYIDLAEISRPRPGDTLLIRGENWDGDVENGTVYSLMTAETDSGWSISRMSLFTPEKYRDTLVVPGASNDHYHLILFQERRYPDRYGSIWVAPYRGIQ